MPHRSSQYQAPTTGLDVVICSERSIPARNRFAIGWSNCSRIGMPTP